MQTKAELIKMISDGLPGISIDEATTWAEYLSQLTGCHLFSVESPEKDEKAWLKARQAGIGGSEIAAIMGENSWSSPRQVWLSKMGMFDDDNKPPQSEAARWGNVLETTVATEYAARENLQWIRIPVIIQSDSAPYLLANIDGFILSDDRKRIERIYEIKTTSAYNEDAWKEGPLPYYYMCQTNWYCGITGIPAYTIVCLCGGQHLYGYDLPADPELFAKECSAAETFWTENVLGGKEPEATDVDKEFLARQLAANLPEPTPIEEALIFTDDENNRLLDSYCELREKIGALNKIKDALYAQIMVAMKGKTQAIGRGHTVVIGTSSKRSCDFKLLAQQFPEAYDECVRSTTSIQLNIK